MSNKERIIKENKRERNINKTIFDDVFRTIVEKMPELIIPVINEIFNEDYPENERIDRLQNEHLLINGKRVTDSFLRIRKKLYHMECESSYDGRIVLRLVEYDFAIALDEAYYKGDVCEINMPKTCVIYLRHTSNTPDKICMRVIFANGEKVMYEVPAVKVKNYTKDEIFEKRLLMFLPFYIIRYEGMYSEIENEPEKLEPFVREFETIRYELDKLSSLEEKSELYTNLIDLIVRISDYMVSREKTIKERIGGVMRGEVLELESERLKRIGREEGIKEGQIEMLFGLVNDGIITETIAAEKIGMSLEDFRKQQLEYNK